MKLTIMIPTYNRCEDLMKNLDLLCGFIKRLNRLEDTCLLISDNHSTDNTKKAVESIQAKYQDVKITYHLNEVNIGLGRNFVKVLELADSEYGLLLGDDDYIDELYLKKVLELIEDHAVGCIIPSYYNIYPNGTKMGRGRDLDKKSSYQEKGIRNCLRYSWRAHQMSGLVFRTEGLFEEC
ncbi:MAG: glycosyltransferase family 2 protein [Clostridiales bacterium]|nr:glycosyltransferase family 2 protein [Clostridiales bacterium]